MKKSFTDIGQIVNPAKFQKIQDDLSIATELAIITVDYLGKPITKHSNCSDFCKKTRTSKYGIYCQKCDSHGGLEAARFRKPFIYICHAGLVDFAIPIIVNDLYLGAFMAGQVLLSELDSENEPERILHSVSDSFNPTKDVCFQESYTSLPIMRLNKIISLANMLLHIGNYCVKEAELKSFIASKVNQQVMETHEKTGYILDENYTEITTINKRLGHESKLIIKPALTYIIKHPKEKIVLKKMAEICNISPSYFSKLFAKENLGNLSDYVNQIKMKHAKELLDETELSIRTIGESLGYDDCGYFIKVFKRHTNATPMEYRNANSAYIN